MLDFFSKKAKGGDSGNDNSEGSTEPAQGPTPAILLEETTGNGTVTNQPLSESET